MKVINSNKFLIIQVLNCRELLRQALKTNCLQEIHRLSVAITELYRGLYSNVLNETFNQGERMRITNQRDLVLVFSEDHPDGAILSQTEYAQLCRRMDRLDRECHVCVPVAPDLKSEITEQIEADNRAGNTVESHQNKTRKNNIA
jgi:hypothetical protein